jgi:hypothetical protein
VALPADANALELPIEHNGSAYQAGLSEFVLEVLRHVGHEMQRQPAHMVYEMMQVQLARRLPGIPVDDETLRDAAARIAVGLPIA